MTLKKITAVVRCTELSLIMIVIASWVQYNRCRTASFVAKEVRLPPDGDAVAAQPPSS